MTASNDPQPAMAVADPWDLPLETMDVSRAEIFEQNMHGEYFRRLRQEDPVHYCPDSDFGPYWSITKFNDIVAVDTNHKAFSSKRDIVIGDQSDDFAVAMFIAEDQPVHDIQRKAVQPAVAPRQLADLEGLIRTRVGNILDGLPVGETFNWYEFVSKELTAQMLSTLFDIPFEDRHLLPYWSDVATTTETVGAPGADMTERERILRECHDYFAELWHERAALPPKFDFISLLAHNPGTKNMIEDPLEFLGNVQLLIVGGNDTTRNSISGGVVALNEFPDEYEKLRANPSLIPNMVSEMIRYQTPLAHMRRTAIEDVEMGGKTIRTGDKVIMWYASGNRDEEVIDRPDEFIVDRDRARHHLAFGFGIHRCMGNRVAEMQIRLLWEEIMNRFERVELVGPPKRIASNFVVGFSDVPVIVHPR